MKKNRIIGLIANATVLTGGEWELIAPYGDFPTADRKKVQKFTRKEADSMVSAFNSVWHRMGKLFRGVPIFHGHPDVDPKNWPDDRRLGKVVELKADDAGLWGKPEYNDLGKQNQAEGWWVYPSPAWLHPLTSSNVIQPDELLSIGLVNTPNIPGSVPWSNSTDPTEDEPTTDIMKEKLCALLGLDPATATDDQCIEKVTAMKADADAKATAEENARTAAMAKTTAETAAAEEKKKADAACNSAKKTRQDCAEAIAANAVRAGVIPEAEREATVNTMTADGADIVSIATKLGEKKKVINTGSLDLGGRKVAISNSRERQQAVQTEVNSRMKRDGISYDEAYKSVENDPQFKPLFEAMKKPGESAE